MANPIFARMDVSSFRSPGVRSSSSFLCARIRMGDVLDCNSIASPVALIAVLDAPFNPRKLLSTISRSTTFCSGIASSHLIVTANGCRGAGPVDINFSGSCSLPILTLSFLVINFPPPRGVFSSILEIKRARNRSWALSQFHLLRSLKGWPLFRKIRHWRRVLTIR